MTFTPDRLNRIAQLERWHFWFVGRRCLIQQLLAEHLPPGSRTILDVGCGTGLTAADLAAQGHRVTGVDYHIEGIKNTRRELPQAALVQADALQLPFKEGCFEAALLLDVLEHVPDRALLAAVHQALRPGGRLLVMAPAMPWLWGYRDTAAGHLRRYTAHSLRKVLQQAQFQVRAMRYYQFWLMPLVIATRLLGRNGPAVRDMEERPLPLLNRLLAAVNLLEVRLGSRIAWPWGSSLIAVCERSCS